MIFIMNKVMDKDKKNKMKISLVQAKSDTDKSSTLIKIQEFVKKAAEQRSDLVVFPEIFMFYSPPEENNDIRSMKAEFLNGEYVKKIKEICKENEMNLVVGVYEKIKGKSKIYNTIIYVDRTGEIKITYRKTHLYDAFNFRESDIYEASDNDFPTFELGHFKLGLMVCYEIRFPEIARTIALKGVDAILVPSAWVRGYNKEDQWLTLVKARAMENTVYVLTSNQIGNVFTGISAASDPLGNIITRASEEEEMITLEIRKDRIENVRKILPLMEQRRPDLYKF